VFFLRIGLIVSLKRKPTERELADFTDYLSIDLPQWLIDDFKSWTSKDNPEYFQKIASHHL